MGGENGVRMMLANSNFGVQELCTKLLEKPLSKCSPFQRKLVVIDALDETEYKSRKDFICLIKERFPRLPEWLVFFITSRPEDMIQSRLEKYNPRVRICAENIEQRSVYQQHEQDIQRFLENSVDFSLLPCSVEDVTRKCNGLFLYAFYIAKELNGTLQSGRGDLSSDLFPGDIEDFFETNLQRVYDKVGADLYSKLLGCIITAPFPLPESFISFVLDREMSDLDEQEVIDAVSQFVVMQTTVTFVHNLIPACLTNKRKAKKLHIDKKGAGEYVKDIFKEILSAIVNKEEIRSVESDFKSFVFRFAVRFLCQHGEKDSLKVVFSCLTCYRFLEERIRSGRFGIYHLLNDFQLAASCFAVEEPQEQNILQEISLTLESDVQVLVESPHLLSSSIRNASDVVQENILIPRVSAAWLEWNVCDVSSDDIISGNNCFATASDKKTVVVAKCHSLLFVDVSTLQIVGGPFQISQDIIAEVKQLEFSSDDKFVFFGRLDKWFSVQRGRVEDLPQLSGNDVVYQWGLITPNGQCIVVKRNLLHVPSIYEHGCITELLALWAVREVDQSRKEMTCSSFDQLLDLIVAGIKTIGKQTRCFLEYLDVDPNMYQAHETFVPNDPTCYYCHKLNELRETKQELSLATVRQLIIEIYPWIYRYQVWNLKTGRPLLEDVFNNGVELDSFTYFCHLTKAFDDWKIAKECFDVDVAPSVSNIAVVTAICGFLELNPDFYLNYFLTRLLELANILELEFHWTLVGEKETYWEHGQRFIQELGQKCRDVQKIKDQKQRLREQAQELDELLEKLQQLVRAGRVNPELVGEKLQLMCELYFLPPVKPDLELFCNSFKRNFLMHFPKGFLDLFGREFSLGLSPGNRWTVKGSIVGETYIKQTKIQVQELRGKLRHDITQVESFTFTNDDLFVVYFSRSDSLHALCLQTGTVFTSVSGHDVVNFKQEKQFGYLFRSGVEERAVFLENLFSPFKFFLGFRTNKSCVGRSVAAIFTSSDTVMSIRSDSMAVLWNTTDKKSIAFKFISEWRFRGSCPAHVPELTKKCVISPDKRLIALQQETKIELHSVAECGDSHYTVLEGEFSDTDTSLKFSDDGGLFVLCIQKNFKGPHFYVWDVGKQAMSESFRSPRLLTVDCFCLSANKSNLILCGEYEVEIWEFRKYPYRLLHIIGVERSYNPIKFSQCAVSLDNELLFCCIANLIFVYNLSVANVHSSRRILRGHLGKIEFCRFLKVNRYLISYAVDEMVFLWDITESKAIGFAKIAQGREKIVSMAVSPEEDRVICFLSSDRVCLINLCKLECALSSKLLTTSTKGKVETSQTRLQPVGKIPSRTNVPNSAFEDNMSDAPDLEERFLLTADDFFESDDSD